MSLDIIKPGFLTTVQDSGRFGMQQYGMIVSGAMDEASYRIGELLLQQENGAALEFTLMGPTIQFSQPTEFALTGANFMPVLNGKSCPMWRPVSAKAGDILKLSTAVNGARGYLHVKGGLLVQPLWDSRSTYLRANIGGYCGRALQAGDVIPYDSYKISRKIMWYVDYSPFITFSKSVRIRMIDGTELHVLTEESKKAFTKQTFIISTNSDRMGYRLESAVPLKCKPAVNELLSEAVAFGTIQLPPNGQPIILMADRQTTGGYPKIAQVAAVDLSTLAQLKPGDTVQFEWITLKQAQSLYLKRERALQQLQCAIEHA